MKPIEEKIIINAPASRIYAIWTDVANWHKWDPDTKEAHLDGEFKVGAKGRIVPSKGSGVPMTVVQCTPNESFTVEGQAPGFKMTFVHQMRTVEGGGIEVSHRVTASGFLDFILGYIVGKSIREGLPKTMLSLKAYAEAQR
jgi:uncharacterized protein YndB with AHSA1/START domain